MRKITAIICSTMFAIFGIGLATVATKDSTSVYAATPIANYTMPTTNVATPFDLLTDKETTTTKQTTEPVSAVDSLHSRIKELEETVKATKSHTKTIKRKDVNRTRGDTVYVDRPVYYLATKIDSEENQSAVDYYEVIKLDSIPQ